MRFVEFLRATVLLSAGAATTLALVTLLSATQQSDDQAVFRAVVWWVVAVLVGAFVGRRNDVNPPIARLLADASAATMMPEIRPGATMVNRLWPLLLVMIAGAALALVGPQIPAIAAGFAMIWSMAWRRQAAAVQAIEERDGVSFFVDRTSPVRPIRLIRTPGFRRERPTIDGAA